VSAAADSPVRGGWVGATFKLLADQLLRRSHPNRHEGVPAHMTSDGLHVTMGVDGLYQWRASLGSGWRNSAVAYRCMVAIASQAASVPLEVLDPNGVALNRRIVDLWNHAPNTYMSSRVMAEITWLRLEAHGQAFLYLDRGESGTGPEQGLHPLGSDWWLEPIVEGTGPVGTGELLGFRCSGAQATVPVLLPSEVLWLRYPDPDDIWGCLSPLNAARFAVDLDDYARRYQTASLRRGGTPGGVVYLGDVDEETHKKVKADLQARHESPEDAGRHLVLSGPVQASYDRISLTPEEVSYLDTRVGSAAEVMFAFGVPHDYLAGGTTYENRAASRTTLWSDTIVPKLDIVSSQIDLTCLPATNETAHFDTSDVDALKESENARTRRAIELVEAGIWTVDEARASLGYDPLPNGAGSGPRLAPTLQLNGHREGALN
jgi:HK97 family phage portal protein